MHNKDKLKNIDITSIQQQSLCVAHVNKLYELYY